jgi:hypothetical protein
MIFAIDMDEDVGPGPGPGTGTGRGRQPDDAGDSLVALIARLRRTFARPRAAAALPTRRPPAVTVWGFVLPHHPQ